MAVDEDGGAESFSCCLQQIMQCVMVGHIEVLNAREAIVPAERAVVDLMATGADFSDGA